MRGDGRQQQSMDGVDTGEIPAEQDGRQTVHGGRVTSSTRVERVCEQLTTNWRTAAGRRHGCRVLATAIPDCPASTQLLRPDWQLHRRAGVSGLCTSKKSRLRLRHALRAKRGNFGEFNSRKCRPVMNWLLHGRRQNTYRKTTDFACNICRRPTRHGSDVAKCSQRLL